MAIKAQFSNKPLQVVATDAMKARILAIAEAEGTSQAAVCRDLIAHGIEWREQVCRERTGATS